MAPDRRLARHDERDDDHRAHLEVTDDRRPLLGDLGLLDHLGSDLPHQLRTPGADHLGDPARVAHSGRGALTELAGQRDLLRVDMGHRHLLELLVGAAHPHPTPVGELRAQRAARPVAASARSRAMRTAPCRPRRGTAARAPRASSRSRPRSRSRPERAVRRSRTRESTCARSQRSSPVLRTTLRTTSGSAVRPSQDLRRGQVGQRQSARPISSKAS